MDGNVNDITKLNEKIKNIAKNSVGTTGFGAAVGVLSVCVLTAIILGSVSLSESNSSATQNINKITANFETGDFGQTGALVNQGGDGKYQVTLDYTNQAATSYIQYLNGVTPGIGGANQALVLNEDREISGVSFFFADIFIGQLGHPVLTDLQKPAYISGLSVTNGSYHNGILISGDTGTNSVTGNNSAVIGGSDNSVTGVDAIVLSGRDNTVSNLYSGNLAGGGNTVGGIESGNVAGARNTVEGSYSCNIAGSKNLITVTSSESVTAGGVSNQIDGDRSFIAAGTSNGISGNSDYSMIGAGQNNNIGVSTSHSFIGGGQTNTIQDISGFSAIIAGTNNGISGSTSRSFIAAGTLNGISGNSDYSIIGAGQDNNIKNLSFNSMIGAGQDNNIGVSTSHSFIGGGRTNTIQDISGFSAIIAGTSNGISGSTSRSFIAAGSGNGISGNSDYSIIGAGQDNNIKNLSFNSMIGAGQDNNIGVSTSHSFIGGGRTNTIQDISGFSAIIAGQNNTILSKNTVILGGQGLSTAPGGSWDYATLCGKYNDPNFYPWEKSASQALPGVSYRFAVGSGTGAGVSQLAFAVDNSGNIYYGTANGASIYQRTGTDQYTAKSFTIQHPTINNRWLRHGCLEGPEGGVYYRGKGEAPATIRLPDYATHIASDFTVQVTPIGSPRMMSASEVSPEGTFRVYGEGMFHWTAIGERVALDPEPLKTDVTIHSVGPYSWSV